MNTPRVWIIGNRGMLGQEVSQALEKLGIPAVGSDQEVSILDLEALRGFARERLIPQSPGPRPLADSLSCPPLNKVKPSDGGERHSLSPAPHIWIVNCAAYTAVDKAEDEPDRCFALNAEGPRNIGRMAEELGAGLIHISTDYVFDGKGIRDASGNLRPYREEDPVAPIGVYARSKAEGETAVLNTCSRAVVLRTAWLYGRFGNNFVFTMLRLMKERDAVRVVADQRGTPTWAADLAQAILTVLRAPTQTYGIYHFTNGGECTWYEFACEIHRLGRSLGLLPMDRSIVGPEDFITTNVLGTFTLLEVARAAWKDRYTLHDPSRNSCNVLFHHISTDEVYGSLGESGYFTESTPYDPRSPYSASKAGSDHLVMAYHHTYGLPVTLTNCSNNYGPYQFPEKLIPLMILNMVEGKPLPVYGDGRNIRDWLYVEDHNAAVWLVMQKGRLGEKYNIGGENEWENIRLLHRLIEIVAEETGKDPEELRRLITFVKDRPGHDRRYAIDCSRIKRELGWKQSVSFDEGLRRTVRWYLENRKWVDHVRSGAYRDWIRQNYGERK
jgi:dTDP-glucose 4,6-dehydratase